MSMNAYEDILKLAGNVDPDASYHDAYPNAA